MQVAEYAQRLSPEAHSSKSWNTRAITDFSSATTEAATTSTFTLATAWLMHSAVLEPLHVLAVR